DRLGRYLARAAAGRAAADVRGELVLDVVVRHRHADRDAADRDAAGDGDDLRRVLRDHRQRATRCYLLRRADVADADVDVVPLEVERERAREAEAVANAQTDGHADDLLAEIDRQVDLEPALAGEGVRVAGGAAVRELQRGPILRVGEGGGQLVGVGRAGLDQ